MDRRDFLKTAGAVGSAVFLGSCGCLQKKRESLAARRKENPEEKGGAMSLKENLAGTEKYLEDYPIVSRRLEGYAKELRERLEYPCSAAWVSYQNNRLDRIRWLVDPKDDGRESGMKLRMRPYDIPWVIWSVGVLDDESKGKAHFESAYNGVLENVEKILNCPDLEIEFTDKFADFCYLCSTMTADGCPKFEGYRGSFPQSAQMDAKLRKDCDVSLEIIGLKWTDTVTARELLRHCIEKAPDPSDFDVFPLDKRNWDYYRRGIAKIKEVRG